MAAIRRDLFLQIGGSADGLTNVAKAGKTALLSLASTSDSVVADVEKAWENLGKGGIDAGVKSMERSFTRTLNTFRTNAQKVVDAPTPAAATQILNVAGAEQAAKAAEAEAAALRLLADSASVLAQRAGPAAAEERVLATALATQALEARNAAVALRTQATALGAIATEAGIAGHGENELAVSHARMGASGMIAEHVVRSLSDSIAAGASPVRALMMEMGRITEAMSLYANQTNATEGAMGKFASFMGGAWGIGISVGVAVLTPLIADLIENKKEAEEAKKALEEYARFMDDLGNFVDKATGKIVEQNKALIAGAKLNREGQAHSAAQATGTFKDQAFDAARSYKLVASPTKFVDGKAIAAPEVTDPKVAAVITEANGNLGKLLSGMKALATKNPIYDNLYRSVLQLGSQAQKSFADYNKIRGEISELDTVGGGGTINSSALVDRHIAELTATTALEKATARLNVVKERGAAIDKMDAGRTRELALQKYDKDLLTAQRAVDSAKEDERNPQFGRHIDVAQATSIIAGIGGRVTSGMRSHALQEQLYAEKQSGAHIGPVAVPGTSDHERGQAIDVAYAPGISVASIKAAFREAGVSLKQVLDEPAQHVFHVAWGAKGRQGPSQETIEKRQQAAADKSTRDAEAYAQLLSRAQEETLKLTRDQVVDRTTAAGLDLKSIELERQRLDGAAQAGADERKWTQAKADGLKLQNDINADLKSRAVRQAEGSALLDDQLGADRDQLDRSTQLLQLQSDLTDSTAKKKEIALQLLDNQEQQERDAAIKLIGSSDPADQAKGDAAMRQIDAAHPLRTAKIDQQYQTPMANYHDELVKNVGDVNEAMGGIEVGGLQSLQENLLGVMNGTKSVAGAFRDMATSIISDIEKIALEKLVLSVIGLKGGGMISGFAGGGIPGFAAGASSRIDGLIRGPGTGTSDSILAMVGGNKPIRVANGESIVTADATKKHWPIIKAMNEGRLPGYAGGMVPESQIYMRGLPAPASLTRPNQMQIIQVTTDKSPLFETYVQRVNGPMAQAAMIGGAQMAQNEMTEDALTRIPV